MKYILSVTAALLISTSLAAAEQEIVFDNQGRVAGRVLTDSSGKASVIYDRSGRITGRTATDSSGTTTIYGSDGSKIGSTTTKK